jgi:VanZ family protein
MRMNPPEPKPSALGYALLTYMTLVIAAITLIPFEFKLPHELAFSSGGSPSDVLENIVLFIPLGFLFHLLRRRTGWRSVLPALCFGVLVSAALETGQLFCRPISSVLMSLQRVRRPALPLGGSNPQARPSSCPVFRTGDALMNVVYLIIPLLWSAAFPWGEGPLPGAMLVLGCSAAACWHPFTSAAGLQAAAVRPPPAATPGMVSARHLPALASFPLEALAVAVTVGGTAQISTRLCAPE